MKVKLGKYQHFKGNFYEVIGEGKHSETLQDLVVYKALYDSQEFGKNALWIGPKERFLENVDEVPRFKYLDPSSKFPEVGVGVIIVKDGKVLMQKRKGSHGEGAWSFPGGHLEFNENITDCARRETFEELGIDLTGSKIVTLTNDIFDKEGKHYITIYVKAENFIGEPKIMEPDKCSEFGWFSWEELPRPLFIPIENLLKQGYHPKQGFKP